LIADSFEQLGKKLAHRNFGEEVEGPRLAWVSERKWYLVSQFKKTLCLEADEIEQLAGE
jgi:hypothetical protein